MKRMKRTGIYKAANVSFNPQSMEAHSYGWWKFVAVVEGKVVFNNYRYSNTTSKHQSKVRRLLSELGIKVDLEIPLPGGILKANEQRYQNGETIKGQTLKQMIVTAEEYLCDQVSEQIIKQQERSEKARSRRLKAKLENYLENELHFRDYEILPATKFGSVNKVAVHQLVEAGSMEHDANNAVYNFQRDGFGSVVFYI